MNLYEQHKRESAYWFSKASDLRGGAAVLWASMNSESRKIPIELGLGEGFRMSVALPSVYRMVCGMSMELPAQDDHCRTQAGYLYQVITDSL
jgi:TPR repeat protein